MFAWFGIKPQKNQLLIAFISQIKRVMLGILRFPHANRAALSAGGAMQTRHKGSSRSRDRIYLHTKTHLIADSGSLYCTITDCSLAKAT